MGTHWNWPSVSFSAAFSQISDQLLARVELGTRRLIAVEITDQADSESNVIEKIAVHMTAVNLTAPAIAHLDFAVAGRGAVADHEMIGESILHPPDPAMVIVKHPRVALSGAAVMHHDEFPAVAGHWRPANFFDH